MSNTLNIAWKILYGLELDEIVNPNLPENIPYIKAKNLQRIEAFEHLKNSPAKVLFEAWAAKIMKANIALLFIPKDKLCLCPTCEVIREIRSMLELWTETELILTQTETRR